MRIHSLHHVAFEGLGSIAAWAERAGHSVTSTWMATGEALPRLDGFDVLFVMGGPMSVHDTAAHPWLATEKQFLASALEHRKPVLGICLGSQLLAEALGGVVAPQPRPEIGWFPVRREPSDSPLATVLPPEFEAFHWHEDAFTLPPGAAHLAASDGGPRQAFAVGDHWLGLQFHLETTPEIALALVDHCGAGLVPGPTMQSAEAMLTDARRFERLRGTLGQVMDAWFAHLVRLPAVP